MREKNIKNLSVMKINSSSMPWVDKINNKDIEFGEKGWLKELMENLPY
jgi:hypothetical protein